jgi:hypothetical protein
MKVHVLPQAEVSSLTDINEMIIAAWSDGKHFYAAVKVARSRNIRSM